jgi:hypothetical protein
MIGHHTTHRNLSHILFSFVHISLLSPDTGILSFFVAILDLSVLLACSCL